MLVLKKNYSVMEKSLKLIKKIEEIGRAVENMKKKEAVRINEISMEAWMFGGEAVSKSLLMNQMWKEENIPKEWRISVVVPVYKKGDQEKTENYRGISLLCTRYKIYAKILRERLEEEIIRKKLLPESQGGFRKGRGTMDNIFILNHVVQREKYKGEKVYALFVDLKAAFDNVDRNKLWRILKDKRIEEQLISRIRSLYKETRVAIRIKEGTTDSFITKKGVK